MGAECRCPSVPRLPKVKDDGQPWGSVPYPNTKAGQVQRFWLCGAAEILAVVAPAFPVRLKSRAMGSYGASPHTPIRRRDSAKVLALRYGEAERCARFSGCGTHSKSLILPVGVTIITRPTPKENALGFLFSACLQFAAAKKGRALLFPFALPMLYASMMFATTPEPTVLPPSLIANRSPFSIAIGVISSISILMLSPGITISTPSGSLMTPVTSVVLK